VRETQGGARQYAKANKNQQKLKRQRKDNCFTSATRNHVVSGNELGRRGCGISVGDALE